MPRFSYLQPSLKSGQVSPLLTNRSDIVAHKNGLKTLKNMTILPQGGVTSRSGLGFVSEVKDSSKKVRLIPFEFSTTDVYVIEMGENYIRFHKDTGLVLESDVSITGITKANPGVVSYTGTDPSNGDQVYITEVGGMTEINSSTLYYTVANVNSGANTFEIQDRDGNNVDTTNFTTYTSGGVFNVVYEIASPYSESDLFDLQFTQSADVITITHEDYAPRNLTRTADTSWTLTALMKDGDATGATLDFVDGPYLNENFTATTLSPSGTGSSITFTASATTGINSDTGFQSTDVGRLIRWNDGSDWFYYEITAINSTTNVDATKKSEGTPSGTTATERWRLGAFSETTGFPKAVVYHQQRRFYAGTKDQPDTVWGSAIDDFPNFTPGTNDSDAVNYTLASNKVNTIYWLVSSARLRMGTEAGIWTLFGGSDDVSITPTNIEADYELETRAKRLTPASLGNTTLFAQRSGKILRNLAVDASINSLSALNVTIASDDILGSPGDTTDEGVTQMAYQLEPHSMLWCTRDDGKFASLSYIPNEEVTGWAEHEAGGSSVFVESVASVPGTGQDTVWFSVRRTINGTTRRYIEKMAPYFRGQTNKDGRFVDSYLVISPESPDATLTPGAVTGAGVTFTAGSGVFASTDVGRVIQSGSSRALITGYTSGTVVTVDVLVDFSSTSAIASGSWTLSRSSVDGLDHLEGEEVSLLVDGGSHPARTVSNGSITLDSEYTDVTVGLGYTREIETLNIDFGSAQGTAYGSQSKVNSVTLEFFESVGGFIGYDTNSLTEILSREGESTLNQGIPLFTGQKKLRPKSGWRDTTKVLIRQTDPLPFTILSIVVKGNLVDD